MQKVNIRDLMHNFSSYLKQVKEGERITILERNKPVVDIVPHNPNVDIQDGSEPLKNDRFPEKVLLNL